MENKKPRRELRLLINRVKLARQENKKNRESKKTKRERVLPILYNITESLAYESSHPKNDVAEAKIILSQWKVKPELEEYGDFVEHNTTSASEKQKVLASRPCRRCGRTLTAGISIVRGVGPVCVKKHANGGGSSGKGSISSSKDEALIEDPEKSKGAAAMNTQQEMMANVIEIATLMKDAGIRPVVEENITKHLLNVVEKTASTRQDVMKVTKKKDNSKEEAKDNDNDTGKTSS